MSKSVVINLGSGDLYNGLPRVTAQLRVAGDFQPEQFIGSLPASSHLVELYRNWQSIYQSLCDRQQLRSRFVVEDDELEIDKSGIVNVSQVSFDELCQKFQAEINQWLKFEGFLHIERQLRSQLHPKDEIRVMLETDDQLLRRLPWHCWDFFQDYPHAEIALSSPEYKRTQKVEPRQTPRTKVRILAILGNSQGIDLQPEIQSLQSLIDAEIMFLVCPSRQEFNTGLWQNPGWDLLFFAGHSQTEKQTGRVYINDNSTHNSLTIAQLEEALKAAIENGLQLAIFNSCDGLGLATALEKLNIPTAIVMREPVPNRVAQDFFRQFLIAFANERSPLYQAVRKARRQLQGLEDDFPAASWLPVICQNPAVNPPTWLTLGSIPPCPYRGLFAFQEADAELFFGRERFVRDLVAAVNSKPLVAVVGSSGSGKSSVVFAGLVPYLRRNLLGGMLPKIISMRPGNQPLGALTAALMPLQQSGAANLWEDNTTFEQILANLTPNDPGTHSILIVDQFEELYTLCTQSDRQLFLDNLLYAIQNAPNFSLILTLRADFYGYALAYRPFSDALQDAVYNLGPMNREELQSVIEAPAAQMQVKLENGLTQKLIQAAWGQPGCLPLLEFALTQLWAKQQNGWLTHQAYGDIGGVVAALANHAEAVYAQLNKIDRQRMQRVAIQLVQSRVGADASRRLATRDEVGETNWDLVTHLASSRLVVTNRTQASGEETVELVHEALIGSWKRLSQWLLTDREFRHWQEQLRALAQQWEQTQRDEGALLRGKPLADAEYWHSKRFDELSSSDRALIQASVALRDRELKQQKRQRQLTIAGLTAGLIGALLLAGVAWRGWQNSVHSEIAAIAASSEALFVSNNRLDALIEAIRAKQKLHNSGGTEAQARVDSGLRQAIYGAVEYNRLSRHSDEIKGVAFSSNGQTVATASNDKTIKLWKRDGTLLATLAGHQDRLWAVAFSPKGEIVSGSTDKTIKLWKRDGTLLKTLTGHSAGVRGVAFSSDGQVFASASDDKTVKLWQRDGALLTTLKGHTDVVNGVAFSSNGQLLASASDDTTVKLWRRDGTLLTTLKGHTATVNGVAFSPDGQLLASTSWDKTVKLWEVKTGKLLSTLTGHTAVAFGVAFSPNSKILASTSWDKTVKLWKRDGTIITTLNGHGDRVWGVAFSPDGNTLASASGDKSVKLWRLHNPLLATLTGHSSVVIGVAFNPNGKTIASASDDKTVKLWQRDGTLLSTLVGHTAQAYQVAFSPDGQTLASASADNTVKLWRAATGKPILLSTLKGHQAVVWGVAFSPDGNTLASASWDNTVKLWSVGTGKPRLLTTLKGHQAAVGTVAFSPDSKMLASSSADNTIKLWKVEAGKWLLLTTLKGHGAQVYGVAFSPDGQAIASASADNTVKLWRRDGKLLTTLKGHNAVVFAVAFSPDGQTLASASWDKTVKLWRRDGTLLTTLNGYNGRFWGVAFSPDGQTLAAANEDETVILWHQDRVLNLDPLKFGCNWVRDYLQTNPNVSDRDRAELCLAN